MSITIIIPHYRHEAYLPDAIQGIMNQTRKLWRIYLMNDDPGCSLKHYENRRIKVFEDGQNKGQTVRWNEAIEKCEDGLIVFQGADDISMPWRLQVCIVYLYNAEYGPDVIYTDAVQLNQNNHRTYLQSHEFDIEILKQRNYIVASTVMVKTELAKEVKFDEDIRYGEDWLWYHKLYKAGATFKYLPIPTVYYRDYTSNIGVRDMPDWHQKRFGLQKRIGALYEI